VQQWCEHAEVALDLSQGAVFNDAALVLQAAVDGQGVALGALDARSSAQRSDVAAFRRWLLEEARQS